MAKKPEMAGGSSGSNRGTGKDVGGIPEPTDKHGKLSVLIELRSQTGGTPAAAMNAAGAMNLPGVQIDPKYTPVTMQSTPPGPGMAAPAPTFIVRGMVDSESDIEAIRRLPEVASVWKDTPISGFASLGAPIVDPVEHLGSAVCPIPPCDCQPAVPKGAIADVATYLKATDLWAMGYKGAGMYVGVLDSGITAQGRPVKSGETTRRIPNVVDGWPSDDWGTESSKWGDHGNMCATDVLGMAPEARLFDLRIAGAGGSPGTISRALQAFQWAIDRHRVDGTPHVLTNSWGIFQENWDPAYARDPNHPFTRKVVEAVNEGILVLFAAGNCGATCPDGRCGPDNGPGRSIWGANSHPMVMTVGAVNKDEKFIGYSSQGPGALDAYKPDFCSVSHFTGYFNSDSGTSAATPIAAGVVALLKQARPSATPAQIKDALKATAKDIGPGGFDQHSGAGIIKPVGALERLRGAITTPIRDRTITVAVLDRINTSPLRDLATIAIRDRATIAALDRGTIGIQDRLDTAPGIDWRKSPFLDTLQERVKPIGDRVLDPVVPPVREPLHGVVNGGGGERPFALATEHHAPSWHDYEYGSATDPLAELESEIEMVSAAIGEQSRYLQELVAAYETVSGHNGG